MNGADGADKHGWGAHANLRVHDGKLVRGLHEAVLQHARHDLQGEALGQNTQSLRRNSARIYLHVLRLTDQIPRTLQFHVAGARVRQNRVRNEQADAGDENARGSCSGKWPHGGGGGTNVATVGQGLTLLLERVCMLAVVEALEEATASTAGAPATAHHWSHQSL